MSARAFPGRRVDWNRAGTIAITEGGTTKNTTECRSVKCVLKCDRPEQPHHPMTSKSAAVYGSCGAILVACLAAANMPSQDADVATPRPPRAARVAPDAIAADVRSQAMRLHERMAEAPVPSASIRNPFAFGAPVSRVARAAPGADMVQAAVAADPAPAGAPAPSLLLMGIA